jgi:hypothetical protein
MLNGYEFWCLNALQLELLKIWFLVLGQQALHLHSYEHGLAS